MSDGDPHPAPRWLRPHARRPARHRPLPSRTARSSGPGTTTPPCTSRTTPTGWSTSTAGWSRPAFVDAHAHLAQTGLRRRQRGPRPAPPACTRRSTRLAAHGALLRRAVLLGLRLGRDRAGPSSDRSPAHELDRATGGRAVYLVPGRRALRGRLLGLPRRLPRGRRTPSGYDATGLVAARRAPRRPRGAVPAAVRGRPGGRDPAGPARTPPGTASAMVHELGAPHICPAEDLAGLRGADRAGSAARGGRLLGRARRRRAGRRARLRRRRRRPLHGRLDRLAHVGAARAVRRRGDVRAPLPRRRPGRATTSSPAPTPAPGRLPRHRRPRRGRGGRRLRRPPPTVLGTPAVVQGAAPPRARRDGRRRPRWRRSAALGVTASMQPMFDGLLGRRGLALRPAPRRRPGAADERLRLDEPRRRRAGVRLRHPGHAVRPVGRPSAPPPGTTPRPSGSPRAPRSTPTPAAAGAPPGATRAA